MKVSTGIFLVLLRLAIGWHFFFEGIEKVESLMRGPTVASQPFSSEGYLREATGPLGPVLRQQIGDPDDLATTRLKVVGGQLTPELKADWDDYVRRFSEYYELNEAQKREAEAKLAQAKSEAVRWLTEGESEVDRPLAPSTVKMKMQVSARVKEYEDKLKAARDIQDHLLQAFDHDVAKQKLREAKAEVSRLRSGLMGELNQLLIEPLQSLLTADQKKKGALPPAHPEHWWQMSHLEWIDQITSWGLLAVGGGLLIGLFTRTACLAGALFLCMLYLTIPPFPWLPQAPIAEGHYYYINKNLIEMLALLTLATTCSGRWLGVDGLVRYLNPLRRRSSN